MSLPIPQRNQLFHQALNARAQKNLAQASALLQKLIAAAPDFAPAYAELGIVFAENGDLQQGGAYLHKAVELKPNDINCLYTLGCFYRNQSDWPHALAYFERASRLAPSNIPLLKDLLGAQRARHDLAGALQTTERILANEPGNLAAAIMRGETLDSMGMPHEASAQFEALLGRPDLPLFAIQRWADIMQRLGRVDDLIKWLDIQIKAQPLNVDLLLIVASVCVPERRYAEALDALRKAHQLDPGNLRVFHDMGVTLLFLGRIDESNQWFKRSLEHDPFQPEALRLFGENHQYQYGDEAFIRLSRAAGRITDYPAAGQVHLAYALGKAYDDVGDYATAFEHYIAAGRLHLKENPLVDKRDDGYIQLVKNVFSRDFFDGPPEPGCDSAKPVFVLGMPRSGTSLVEQVLSSHPDAYGAGELKYLMRAVDGMRAGNCMLQLQSGSPFFKPEQETSYRKRGEKYVDALSALAPAGAQRIIDKMPGNYTWIGFIRLILPGAKIIHCRRHPVETCLSAFRIFFSEGNSFSSDLAGMGKMYRYYEDLMEVWRSSLPPGALLEIRYEDLVVDFESQARRMIDFIGLEWTDDCLNFHQNNRAVRTASVLQVRKPLYRTSINRWRKYETWLKPLLDELGPLVAQYEAELERVS